MTLDRLLALLSMTALACVAGTGVARIVALARVRVRVLPIDRERPGELVMHGVFAFTRNPIYVALMLLAAGVALMLGSPLLITLACACPFYFGALVRREEVFLAGHYGQAYEEYRARTPRWLR